MGVEAATRRPPRSSGHRSCTAGAWLSPEVRHGRVGTAELTADQDGGDEGRGGARAEVRSGYPVGAAEMEDQAGGDREREVGPGQPGQGGEQTWPERVRDRGSEGVGRLGTARDMVRERPPDEGGQDDRDAHQPGGQDAEGAEALRRLGDPWVGSSSRSDCGWIWEDEWAWSSSCGDAAHVGGGLGHR